MLYSPSAPQPGLLLSGTSGDTGQRPGVKVWTAPCEIESYRFTHTHPEQTKVAAGWGKSHGPGRAGPASDTYAMGLIEAAEGTAHWLLCDCHILLTTQSRTVVTCGSQWAPYILAHSDLLSTPNATHPWLGKDPVGGRGALDLSGCGAVFTRALKPLKRSQLIIPA